MTSAQEPMRIGIAAPADIGLLAPLLPRRDLPDGLGSTVISRLVRAFLEGGDQVVLYTLDPSISRPLRFERDGFTLHIGPYRARHRMRDLMAVERRTMRDMVLSDPPDVVSAHWCYEFALGARAAGRPTLISVCDWAPTILRHSPDLYRLGRLAMFGWTLATSSHLAAPSPHIAGLVRRFSGKECAIVGQPLEESSFCALPRSWPGGDLVLASIANGWGRLKNTSTLLRAFALFRQGRPTAHLTFYGHDHGPGQAAEQWARTHHLADNVRFAGFQPNALVLDALSRAHLYIHPSLEESFGQVVLEAMAAGTPVIGGHRSGAVPWLLDQGGAGLLVDPLDAEALCGAMDMILCDPARWESLSAAGLARARGMFTAPAIAANYRSLLRALKMA
jgi:glycosyltransferase involved in cell wall biosynthesis